MSTKVQVVIAFMKDNLHRRLSLRELAELVKLSTYHLSHLFSVETGLPPIKYLKMLRMEKSRELLHTSLLSIKEVTAKVGLNDESHFMRDFKRTYGLTPSQYRANNFEPGINEGLLTQQDRKIG